MPASSVKNVIFCGVGGQGVILASKVLMDVAMKEGHDVKESEVHGMAQRGGSVECNVRFGEKIYSPLISKGGADYIVSLELLESLRKVEFLKDGGTLLVNSLKIDPVPVQLGAMKYPENIEYWLKENVPNNKVVDTSAVLKELGNVRVLNIVMLGVLSKYMDFEVTKWENAIRANVKEQFVDLNLKAFHIGRSL